MVCGWVPEVVVGVWSDVWVVVKVVCGVVGV